MAHTAAPTASLADDSTNDGQRNGADGADEETAPPDVEDTGATDFVSEGGDGSEDNRTRDKRRETTTTVLEGGDLPGYEPTEADRKLDLVFGDHVHLNDGCHLKGGIDTDGLWQRRWRRVVQLSLRPYHVPKGTVGRRFIAMLTAEFCGARERRWNSERPIVFVATILQSSSGRLSAADIRRRLSNRMDAWADKRYEALVRDTEMEGCRSLPPRKEEAEEREARKFNAAVLNGELRRAVRHLTSRGGGGVLDPDGPDTKTGERVAEVLAGKHPDLRMPDPAGSAAAIFAEQGPPPETIPIDITAETVEKIAPRLSGSAGPGGTDAKALRWWLLGFGAESEALREEMAAWSRWLANTSPDWAAYRAVMAARLVPLDKQPGVRPIGIGEIFRRLLAKCLLLVCGSGATASCGASNLCVGLKAGVEGAAHAMSKLLPSMPSRENASPDGNNDDAASAAVETQGGIGGNSSVEARVVDDDPEVMLLVDARNGFNELNRVAAMWTIRHRWPEGARFAFNCYRHSATLVLRRPGQDGIWMQSKEGVTQGDPLSMVIYGIALAPLTEQLLAEEPRVRQAWFADDSAMRGRASLVGQVFARLCELGPVYGYYPEPEKSAVVCDPAVRDAAAAQLDKFDLCYSDGKRYVGAFLGSRKALERWLQPQIDDWVYGVKRLAMVARRYPQTAYAGLVKSLQCEWQFVQRVTRDAAQLFTPIEEAIKSHFLPALIGQEGAVDGDLRALLCLSTRRAGIGVYDPVATATPGYQASSEGCVLLVRTLVRGTPFSVDSHEDLMRTTQATFCGRREKSELDTLESIKQRSSAADKRRLGRAGSTGAWLTTMPSVLNGTALSA